MAPVGKALLVGLTGVDPKAYNGWDGEGGCWGCEMDVDNMENLLAPLDYNISILKTKQARANAILSGVEDAAHTLVSGDIFVFYFSGHGGQQPDQNSDGPDGKVETLIAYDRAIIDKELCKLWLRFRSGVRIFMISDSCNSGANYRNRATLKSAATPMVAIPHFHLISMMRAKLIHMGGCRDGYGSTGSNDGGAVTTALCEAWNEGLFTGNYPDFHQAICAKLNTCQQPQYSQYGYELEKFRNQKPFTINELVQVPYPFPAYEYEICLPIDPPPWAANILDTLHSNAHDPVISIPDNPGMVGKTVVRLKTRTL